jgi:hypothetical protein
LRAGRVPLWFTAVETRRRAARTRRASLVAAAFVLSSGLAPATVGTAASDRLRVETAGDRVTVQAVGVPAKSVVAELRAAGLADLVGARDAEGKSVTIQVESVPVELVMRQLLRQIGAANHAVRYDAATGMATFVVVGDSIGSVSVARDEPVPVVDAPPPVPVPTRDPTQPRPPARLKTSPEEGFGALLLRR